METPAASRPERRRLRRSAVVGAAAVGLTVLGALIPIAVRTVSSRPRAAAAGEGHWQEVARGQRMLRLGRPDAALEAVSHVRDERPGAAEAMYVAGMALAQMEQYRPARLALERSLTLQPDRPRTLRALAALYLSQGDSARGLECLKRAAGADPNDFRPWFAMGKVYLDLGRSAEAASAYAEASRRAPGHEDAKAGRVEALIAANRAEEAGPLVDAMLAAHPDAPRLLGLAAAQARETGGHDRALDLARRALAIDPDEPEALLTRATLTLRAGKPAEALPDLQRLVALNPNKLAALTLKAQVEFRLGLADRAAATARRHRRAVARLERMDALSKEISARPDDPEPRYRLGLVALEGGQLPLARSCFMAALAVRPDFRPARERLEALGQASADESKNSSADDADERR